MAGGYRAARFTACVLVLLVAGFVGLKATEPDYIGSKKCKMCHLKQWQSWSETAMAKALDDLRPGTKRDEKVKAGLEPDKDYTKDESCLGCHTTGYGKPGGFVSPEETPDHVGVGCEMCHGPGGTYTLSQHMSLKNKEYKKADLVKVGLVDKVGADQCQVCHNADSPFVPATFVFDFEANRSKGTHENIPLKYPH